jgi:hypothetical protein
MTDASAPPALLLAVQAGELAVVRLAPDAPVPAWVPVTGFSTVSRTADELSVVCDAAAVPDLGPAVPLEAGWVSLKLQGPFAFTLTGILAAVLVPLADAGIGIFALSTFDTDYVLVKQHHLDGAVAALRAAGHTVTA